MLYLSKNSMFKLKCSHGNHIHNFENIYCAHDYFGSKYPVVRVVTLFIVQSMHVHVWKVTCKYKKFIFEAKGNAHFLFT